MSICPYLRYEDNSETQPAAKCICRKSGCIMSVDDLMVQFVCSNKYDEFKSCKEYMAGKSGKQGG